MKFVPRLNVIQAAAILCVLMAPVYFAIGRLVLA